MIHSHKNLVPGTLIRRYKRFLADVRLSLNGSEVTAFCPNSGSMMGLNEEGMPVLLSSAADPQRKTRWTLEAVRVGRTWVAVNTHLTNTLARTIIERGLGSGPLRGCRVIRPEIKVGGSRLDFLLEDALGRPMYLEVKSVTLRVGREARFPDAITTRGARHLRELSAIARQHGHRAAMLYMVQRSDCTCFRTADDIDPAYGEALRAAIAHGVEASVQRLVIRKDGIYLGGRMEPCGGPARPGSFRA